jgi:ATP-dependent Clp protease ATP-binding subunit ClpX
MTVADEAKEDVACSFCLKPTTDVQKMVAGPGVFICNECVGLCVELIDNKPADPPNMAARERELSDEDLLAILPKIEAAGAQAERRLAVQVRHARDRGITWTRIGAALDMTRQSAWERFSGEE